MSRLASRVAGLLLASTLALAEESAPPRHLIYLHGRIVQVEQSRRPQHPQYGYYELDRILDTFRERGFVVHGELRPLDATVDGYADRVVEEVCKLVESGVPPGSITVVGASMGAAITLRAAARLQHRDVRFVTLGACLSESVRAVRDEEGQAPSGRLLAIREASDDLEGPCPAWSDAAAPAALRAQEVVLETGLGHGFLYRPLAEWVCPSIEWAAAPPGPCESPEHRAFDFWLGEWSVYTPADKLAGVNRIEREYDGCVIHERYTGSGAYRGESLNVYDASRKLWHQSWVDNSGTLLLLEGGKHGASMVLEGGVKNAAGAATLHRITWTPNPDGTVRQHWEKKEGPAGWVTVFDGLYRRTGGENGLGRPVPRCRAD